VPAKGTIVRIVARILFSAAAFGAAWSVSAQNQAQSGDADLSEVIVTANRMGETAISRLPMSVVAQTQKSLDELGIKTSQDLQRIVPSLRIGFNGGNGPPISIRGIQGNNAATTGVYLDESPLQARTLGGLVTGGGTFLPLIFDLERIEVLKGPQGTLYGSSSEGGTIRYITPEPGLSTYSSYTRAEFNSIEDGDTGGELGVAVGGPIVQDKLGFRVSVWGRRIGGWVDHVDWRTGQTVDKDTNSQDQKAFKGALKWRATENLSFTPSFYYAWDRKNDLDTIYNDVPQYTTPAFGTVLSGPGTNSPISPTGTLTGLPLTQRGMLPAGYTPSSPIACPITGKLQCYTNVPGYTGQTVFIHPAHTYGPIDVGPYTSLSNTDVGLAYTGEIKPALAPRTSRISLGSLTADLDAGAVQIKSITSWMRDAGAGNGDLTLQEPQNSTVTVGGGYNPFVQSPFIFDLDTPYSSAYFYTARRHALTQEVRASAAPSDSRLSWVTGAYYQNANTISHNEATQDRSALQLALEGHTQLGISPLHSAAEVASNLQTATNQKIHERRVAVFGEGNFDLTRTLKLTAGVRWAEEELAFTSYTYGLLVAAPFTGNPNGAPNTPGVPVTGDVTEHPITYKLSLAWQATEDDLFYATAASGFRPGGVQSQATAQCATDLAQLNITSTPASFGSDKVWSYELGSKMRMADRKISLSGSVFRINWDKPQTPYLLPTCVFSYIQNIGKAVSQGFDMQGDWRVTPNFTLNSSLGYTDAHYTETVQTVPNAQGVRSTLVFSGQDFVGIPHWQGTLGARYGFNVFDHDSYVTASWQYTGKVPNATPAGTSGYAPDAYFAPSTSYVTARVGMLFGDVDVSLFADNLTNEDALAPNTLTGRASCRNADCSVFASYYNVTNGFTFRPRTIGLTAIYRL
jgi:outer membrane receptor protein involved in Fe transport